MPRPVFVVILAGGAGTRMKGPVPKVLQPLMGRPVIGHVVDAARALVPRGLVVVGGQNLPDLKAGLEGEEDIVYVRQARPRGTADAVKKALSVLPARGADVLILCGDVPLIRGTSLKRVLAAQRRKQPSLTVVTAEVADPTGLGRIVRDGRRRFQGIVEEKDATEDQRRITEINSGIFVLPVGELRKLLPKIRADNAQKEYYLTDLVTLSSGPVQAWKLPDAGEAMGLNHRSELVAARRALKERIIQEHTRRGVIFEDPDQTHLEVGVRIGSGTIIRPFCVIRRGVSIAARCEVGPFAHLRGGTRLATGSRIGNFVEVKSSSIGPGSTAQHLAYLGDAILGVGVNVGAGTVIANYDGQKKHQTVVEDGAFLGSGTTLVAPVTVGRNARTGAGAVVPAGQDIPPGETVAGVPARPLGEKDAAGQKKRRTVRTRRKGDGRPASKK